MSTSKRYYVTQYLGEVTVMERIDNHDYLKTRRIVSVHHSPNSSNYELAQTIADLLNDYDKELQ